MKKLYVIDTNSVIFYFYYLFGQNSPLSKKAQVILDQAFSGSPDTLISIPAIVFVEIYDKWLLSEDFAARFYYEVFLRISQAENIEIRPVDSEVMVCLTQLDGTMIGHDLHDKLVLASAMALQCPLITTDQHIREYVANTNVIPEVIR